MVAERREIAYSTDMITSDMVKEFLSAYGRMLLVGVVIGGAVFATFFVLWFLGIVFAPFPYHVPQTQAIVVPIKKGASARDVAQNLFAHKLIRSPNAFLGYVRVVNREGMLRSGNFVFHEPLSVPEILAVIKTGANEKEIKVLEGWTVAKIATYLEEQGFFPKEDFFEIAQPHEGYLFPDTYRVFEDATPHDIVALMRDNFDQKIVEIYRDPISLDSNEIGSRNSSLEDIVIMASLLEREVPTFQERAIVAGLLWKRLEAGMPLQVDATLTYVTGRGSLSLTTEDLALDSPYNTYRNIGLPPGPIANPGLKSLRAAMNPEPSRYWFYLSDSDGNTHFSVTFEEHKQKKFQYLRLD
jgi:UPF0755 protein